MKDEMKNNPPGQDPGSFRQRLEDYLEDRMSPGERNSFELEMMNDPFLGDAAEGIELSGNRGLHTLEQEINRGLKKQLDRNRRKRKKLPDMQPALIAVILILLLLLISYLVIRKFY